ncbi:MAG: hypothetical protein K9K86_02630 [Pseudomonadales bacterium]|nr:hypothetical protein [Pseudomonadales bacterium]
MRTLIWLCFVWCGWAAAEAELGLPTLVVPQDNPQSPAKIALGERLFHDARFSQNGQISCASCHNPTLAFTDHSPVSEGIRQLKGARNAPTVINAAFAKTQFWDGRAADLEAQAIGPMLNPVEMGMPDGEAILSVVREDNVYQTLIAEVFGVTEQEINLEHIAKAIASFERTLIAGNSPFDRYYFEKDQDAISQAAKRGLSVFYNQAACASCHTLDRNFALFTDHEFHNIGVGYQRIDELMKLLGAQRKPLKMDQIKALAGEHVSELGRFLVSGDIRDLGAFKTSSLRNIEKTPPYMHDGSLKTLEEVVEYYDKGGEFHGIKAQSRQLDARIRPLHLNAQQKSDLVAFMRSLTSPEYQSVSVFAR